NNPGHKRLRRLTQFMELLPLNVASNCKTMDTPQGHIQQQETTSGTVTGTGTGSGSATATTASLYGSQLEVNSASVSDNLNRSASFQSEEILLDILTGEELPRDAAQEPHR
ncbi:hypothetical protein KR074_003306, partial [Drosophila pseudoananassae]